MLDGRSRRRARCDGGRHGAALASSSPTAVRWTKRALNGWLLQALPAFDASLAYEFLGFAGSDAREGLAALGEKRSPDFGSS
jgi:enoyl-CoA hydratase